MMEFVSWDDEILIYYGTNKKMFQTTNLFFGGQYDGYLDAAVEKKLSNPFKMAPPASLKQRPPTETGP